jgi:hypothetical protein
MGPRILIAALALVIAALGFGHFEQRQRIERLASELEALRERADEQPSDGAAPGPVPAAYVRPPSAPSAMPPAAVPHAAPPAAPRVAVSQDEVARIESAVLRLLEEDRPELREKLRAVVQEQQQTLEQEQRERRRERWITRREARLLEIGNEVGLTPEQRQGMLHVMLATRDQIEDVRQSAQTPEAMVELRDKLRALRVQTDNQIRELLKPEQYEAYRARFDDDDDDPQPRRSERAIRTER